RRLPLGREEDVTRQRHLEHAVGQLRGQPGRIKPPKIPPPQNLRQLTRTHRVTLWGSSRRQCPLPPVTGTEATWPPRTEGAARVRRRHRPPRRPRADLNACGRDRR